MLECKYLCIDFPLWAKYMGTVGGGKKAWPISMLERFSEG